MRCGGVVCINTDPCDACASVRVRVRGGLDALAQDIRVRRCGGGAANGGDRRPAAYRLPRNCQ